MTSEKNPARPGIDDELTETNELAGPIGRGPNPAGGLRVRGRGAGADGAGGRHGKNDDGPRRCGASGGPGLVPGDDPALTSAG